VSGSAAAAAAAAAAACQRVLWVEEQYILADAGLLFPE
jgi:hypothetical protein